MSGALLLQACLLISASPSWGEHLRALRIGEAPPPGLVARSERVLASAPRGLATGLLETGLLAELNRVKARFGGPGESPKAAGARAFLMGRNAAADWVVALDPRGRVQVAMFRVMVPVDRDADPQGGYGPGRLRRRAQALAEIGRSQLRVVDRDRRGNAFGWAGTLGKAMTAAHYNPERDEIIVLVYP